MFEKYKIISFDIFDTLLERRVFNPTDIFEIMSSKIEDKFNLKNFNFCYIRKLAEKIAFENNKKNNIEEVTFDEIYNQVQLLTSFPADIIEMFKKLEIDLESKYLTAKQRGRDLFELANREQKEIILVSDTYYDKHTIQFFLKLNKFKIKDSNILLSSELKAKKQNGKIFEKIFAEYKNKNEILHIGDNYEADIINAKKIGLSVLFEENKKDKYLSSKFYKEIFYASKDIAHCNHNYLHGYLSLDKNIYREDYFTNVEDLGRYAFAPLLLGFTQWLIQKSIRDNVTDLYFLARDGKVMKDAYDILSKRYKGAPKSHYILASRKACNTIKLTNFYEVLNVLKIPYTNVEIKDLFYQRFSLEEKDYISEIKKYGFEPNSKVSQSKDGNSIIEIIRNIQEIVFDTAKKERKLYFYYLNNKKLLDAEHVGVVDIGYTGTMQGAISELIKKEVNGYYLITFYEAIDKVYKYGNEVSAYISNFDNKINSVSSIIKKIPIYETMFSSEECSFIKFKLNENKEIEAIYQEEEESEKSRREFVKKLHEKTLEEIRKFDVIHKENLKYIYFDPFIVSLPLNHFLKNKKIVNEVLKDVYFEDRYTGSVLNNVHDYYQEIRLNFFNKFVIKIMSKFLSYKKKKKLENNTAKFFLESNKNSIKMIGKYVFGVKTN